MLNECKVSGMVRRFNRSTDEFVEVDFTGIVEQEVRLKDLPYKLTYIRILKANPSGVLGVKVIHVSEEDPPLKPL